MSRSFKVGENELFYDGDIDSYNAIKKRLDDNIAAYMQSFLKVYDDCENAENFINDGAWKGQEFIHKAFLSFGDVFISNGIYNFDISLLKTHRLYNWVMEPFGTTVGTYIDKYSNIVSNQEDEKSRRDYRKATRGRVIGGGFGVGGAVKGMAMAGAVNMGTGLLHGAYNMVGNAMTDFAASSEKENLYKNNKQRVMNSFELSMSRLLAVLTNLLEVDDGINFNIEATRAIVENMKKGMIAKEQLMPAYIKAFQAYPYYYSLYQLFIVEYPQYEKDILQVADYFYIDLTAFLKKIHEVNSYYFENVAKAQLVRGQFEKLAKIYDKDMPKSFFANLHTSSYLVEKEEPAYAHRIIKEYKNLLEQNADDEIVVAYYNHFIAYFGQILAQLKHKSCGVKNDYDELDFSLAKIRLLINNANIYIGEEKIANDYKQHIISTLQGAISNESRFYLVVDGDPQLILCSEGLITLSQSDASKNAMFDIKNALNFTAEATDDFMGSSLLLNGATFFDSVDVKYADMTLLTKAVNLLLPTIFFSERKHRLEIAPTVEDITDYGKCYEFGCGVEKDINTALTCYGRAALYNHSEAQYLLYSKYQSGEAVAKDMEKAKFWLYQAARGGNQAALIDIMENTNAINQYNFSSIDCAVSGNEFAEALKELEANGYGLDSLEGNPDKLATLNNFTVQERITHVLFKWQASYTKSCYYCYPNIPAKKLNNALNAYAYDLELTEEQVLLLFDKTTFGSAKEGFIFTNDAILTDQRVYVKYEDIVDLQYQNAQFFILLKGMSEYALLYTSNAAIDESTILFNKLHEVFNIIYGRS